MRTKVTLALLFLNVALFFFIFYLKTSIAPPTDAKGTILGSEVVNLQSLEIAGINRATPVRLEKRGEEWVLTQPVEWPANEHAVSAILTELQQLRSEASFAVRDLAKNGQTLADYGLDNPPLTVTLTPATPAPGATAPHSSILRIGDTAKVGNRLYILSPDGERVHVVHRSLAESLSLKLEDLRSAEIFKIKVFEVRSLNLQLGATPNAKVRIARDNSRWKFESPIQARANKSETDVTISRLNGLRVESFVDPRNTEPLHLNPDEMTMRITLEGNNRRETLVLGARAHGPASPPAAAADPTASNNNPTTPPDTEWYYAKLDEKNPTFIVSVPTVLLKSISTAQETLRDRQILDFDPATVTGVTVSAAGQPDVSLQRLESTSANPLTAAWQIVRTTDRGPQTIAADREGVERLLRRLSELSAKEFISDAPVETALENFGFNRPARRIRIMLPTPPAAVAPTPSASGIAGPAPSLAAPAPSLVVLLGIGEDHRIYAKLESPNYVYLVSEDTLSQIPIDPLSYRERVLRDLPPGANITAIKLTDLSAQTVLLDTALPLPPASPADTAAAAPANPHDAATPAPSREAIEKLAAQLRTLRAKRFVHNEFTKTVTIAGEERPWRYQLVCTLSLVGGNGAQTVTSRLFFSERIGGNTQLVGAADPEFDVVFEAEQPLIDALFAVTYGPHDPGPTPPSASETPVETPAK